MSGYDKPPRPDIERIRQELAASNHIKCKHERVIPNGVIYALTDYMEYLEGREAKLQIAVEALEYIACTEYPYRDRVGTAKESLAAIGREKPK